MIFANAVILSVRCWNEQHNHIVLSQLSDCPELSLCVDIPATHLSSKTGQDFLSSFLMFSVPFGWCLRLGARKQNTVWNFLLPSAAASRPCAAACTWIGPSSANSEECEGKLGEGQRVEECGWIYFEKVDFKELRELGAAHSGPQYLELPHPLAVLLRFGFSVA